MAGRREAADGGGQTQRRSGYAFSALGNWRSDRGGMGAPAMRTLPEIMDDLPWSPAKDELIEFLYKAHDDLQERITALERWMAMKGHDLDESA